MIAFRTLLPLALVATAVAQEPPPRELPAEVRRVLEQSGRPVPAEPGATAPAPAQADPRAQQLKQLRFDRRSSAILEAWSAPEPMPVDEDPELALPEEPTPPAEGEAPDPELAKKKAEIEQKRLKREMEIFARDVTLGRWERVGAFLESLPEKDRKPSYLHLLNVLQQPPPEPQKPGQQQVPNQFKEQNVFTFDDVLGLAGAAPDGGIEREQITPLGKLLQRALSDGRSFEELMQRLRAELALPEDARSLDRRGCALLLAAIGREAEMGEFLPTAVEAVEADDREALNLLARHYLAVQQKEGGTAHLERAWEVTQAALAAGEIEESEKTDALRRAVGLAPRIRPELGQAWLEESFTDRPERGAEVLATIGAQAARGQQEHARDVAFRTEGLRLQKTAVEALLQHAPERAEEWADSLRLLASNWIREAQHSYRYSEATSFGPIMQRDPYGNIFYVDRGGAYGRAPVAAIDPTDLLEFRPDGRWLDLLEDSVRPEIASVTARLYLKVNEETLAFPFIGQLAETHPEEAKELAAEFLRVWIRNNDPNSDRNRTSSYMFAYGYNVRASGIPLTRSKQERNLKDLAHWVEKLRALPIGDLDESLLVRAFTSSHSAAEVYRLDTIRSVFGSLDALDAETIASLAQQMRTNLAGLWRVPRVQEAAKTNRKQKDIEREVMRGYEVARRVLSDALKKHGDAWQLVVAQAALLHDQNNYRAELEATSEFADDRAAALARFRRGTELYAAGLDPESTKDETSEPYEAWFYAALGASDIGAIDERTTPAEDEFPQIRAAIEALPGEAAERHMARFANSLFTRISAVNPAVKFRYLDAGFSIVGDHPQAREARKIYQYYRDLVTEIRLDVRVDGDDDVGHGAPFGVRVDLVHTREIERESGGFAKYLQNQNNQSYAYNYGRPTENYRDKFEEAARAALNETFDVLSVTFNDAKVNSKATEDYGWRRTPYAYLLLQARGPEIDRIPPLKMDLDFLDTSGYVVLPIESPAVPIDASVAVDAPRPHDDVEITQILDEREAEAGELSLEIKAQARGLVPDLDELVDLSPPDFEVVSVDDPGVTVSRFDDDQEEVLSERLWTVSMRARDDLADAPRTFRFATPVGEVAKVIYQRYDDADLMPAEQEVLLAGAYGGQGWSTWWILLPVVLVVGAVVLMFRKVGAAPEAEHRAMDLPERLTPFTVIGLLETLEQREGLDANARQDLRSAIATIERHYFAKSGGPAPDLRRIAEEWIGRAG